MIKQLWQKFNGRRDNAYKKKLLDWLRHQQEFYFNLANNNPNSEQADYFRTKYLVLVELIKDIKTGEFHD